MAIILLSFAVKRPTVPELESAMAGPRENTPNAPAEDVHWALRPKLPAVAVAVWIIGITGTVSALVTFALVTGH